ncbi:MAG: transcription elongation factor subunit Spt4 [Candidatus Undinarchaeales archaeon]|jgi:DNA-directed RNA polymerase subunit E"|nr:transcription elongation factor subunit Spt4 [Candidatus Undinarchaeales archaeon]
MTKKACKSCRFISEGQVCPICQGTELSARWRGLAVIINPEKSEVAKKLEINQKGEYALIVQ